MLFNNEKCITVDGVVKLYVNSRAFKVYGRILVYLCFVSVSTFPAQERV